MNEMYRAYLEDAYRQHYGRVLRYLLVLCHGDESTAHDLTQETFYRAMRYIVTNHPDEVYGEGWFVQIAKNVFFNHYKKHVTNNREVLIDELPHEIAQVDELSFLFEYDLDEEDRQFLEYYYKHGEKYSELAVRYGITEAACKKRMERLRQRIQHKFVD